MTASQDTIASLVAALSETDPAQRRVAAEKLAGLENEAGGAAVALVQAAADPDDAVRQWATAALEQLGPPPTDELAPLIALLQGNPAAEVAYWATTLIGRMGADAAPAVGPLTTLLDSSANPSARQRAAWALGKIGPPATAAGESLERALKGSDPRLARLASAALEQIRT